uniref:DUF6923 family protein n=1 Tax=Xylophilus sp. ASV27 TaxID=2795129 RepID=UPI0018EC1DFE|nr:hypothetical protein [Xylophilus sp. ASV27]
MYLIKQIPAARRGIKSQPKGLHLRISATIALMGLTVSQAAFSQANIPPVACDARLYISQGNGGPTSLYYSNGSLPLSFALQGNAPAGVQYNALGMSPAGLMYAMNAGDNVLLQINPANGSVSTLGPVTGLPAAS